MEDEQPPITITELVQLVNLGVPLQQVTWSRVTMTSDQYICIRHEVKDGSGSSTSTDKDRPGNLVMLLNLQEVSPPHEELSMAADSAAMSPQDHNLAVKCGCQFKVMNRETRLMVSKCSVVDEVHYWTWVTNSLIAIITDTAVLHWHIFEGSMPAEVFPRHDRLAFAEIVSYKCDQHQKWYALTGLLPQVQEDYIQGVTQLFSVENELTQCIEAHTVSFARYRFEGNAFPSTILCVASREADAQGYGKVHVIELGPYTPGNLALSSHADHIKFVEDGEKYDFPINLQVSPQFGLLYVITKYGMLYICDLETAACLGSARISPDVVFSTILNSDTDAIVGVSRGGQVLAVEVKKEQFVQYVRDVAKKPIQASRLAKVLASR